MLKDFVERLKNSLQGPNKQKGVVFVTVALGLSALLGMGALVVDLGGIYLGQGHLQNVADAAALAGAAEHKPNHGGMQIISTNQDFGNDQSFVYTAPDGYKYTFQLQSDTDTLKATSDAAATDSIKENSQSKVKSLADAKGETKFWKANRDSTMANQETASYTTAYCYEVNLTDTLDTYFARFFNIGSFDAEAKAMAVVYPTDETVPTQEEIDDFVKVINASIYNTIPNFYWESIAHGSLEFNISTSTGELKETRQGYGLANPKYYTDNFTTYVKTLSSNLDTTTEAGQYVLAYGDKYTVKNNEKIYAACGPEITGTKSSNVVLAAIRYTLDSSIKDKGVTALFLDRPNTHSDANANKDKSVKTFHRATILDIDGGTLLDDKDTPFYIRVESEPITVGSCITLVQPVTINVNGTQNTPIVVAYDGPDRAREAKDAPGVNTTTGETYEYKAYEPAGLTATSTKTPAPFVLDLNGHNFKGVIYAPYSKLTIKGSGKIIGFVLAAEIDDQSNSGRKISKSTSTIPTWTAKVTNSSNTAFDYILEDITQEYQVTYDTFHNFTFTAAQI